MYIEELEEKGSVVGEESDCKIVNSEIIILDAKRVLVGVGARALFYPTLLYNVVRNKFQPEFHWWDRVDEFLLLGAVPFPSQVLTLKELGVHGVITLNEPYETLVPSSLYQMNGIEHLVIPTRDYCFAPSLSNICQAVEFIHEIAKLGRTTYVHCKAGRGRSTTVVLCYLIQHKQMTPDSAYGYVKSIRPRVRLASAQWEAVQQYYLLKVRMAGTPYDLANLLMTIPSSLVAKQFVAFDDNSVVVVTESDLDGYDPNFGSYTLSSKTWADLSMVCKFGVASKAAIARISCVWFGYQAQGNLLKLRSESSCTIQADPRGGISVDIQVY